MVCAVGNVLSIRVHKRSCFPGSMCSNLRMMIVSCDLAGKNRQICGLTNFSLISTFLHNWKMAIAVEITNEKNDNWRAFHAFRPSTPSARGINVMAFSRTKTIIGITIFFNFDLRATEKNELIDLSGDV